jgi:hypothetical protein
MENAINGNENGHSSSKLKLPCWIKEDTTHGEKGKLLYIEPWGRKERRKQFLDFSFGIGTMAFVALMSIIFAIGAIIIEGSYFFALFLFCVAIFSLWFFNREFQVERSGYEFLLPFTIYENGCTSHIPENRWSFGRQEVFIPWTSIKEIDYYYRGYLEFTKQNEQVLQIPIDDLSDVMEVFTQIIELVPEKTGENIADILTTSINDFQEHNEFKPYYPLLCEKGYKLSLIFNIVVGLAIGPLLFGPKEYYGDASIPLIPSMAIITQLGIMLFTFVYWRNYQLCMIDDGWSISEEGISFPFNLYGRNIRTYDLPIGFDRIGSLELILNNSMEFRAKCVLFSGEVMYFSPDLIFKLKDRKEFKLDDKTLTNKIEKGNSSNSRTWNKKGILKIAILYAGLLVTGIMLYLMYYLST